jgi:UTP--glucose-1-phosphate uridylyltransferase
MTRPIVTKALIPCGGKGTRMLALTGGRAKELLPVAGVPVLGRVLAECAASGVRDVLIVVAPGKDDLVAYAAGVAGQRGFPARVDFAEQRDARGLADAIRLGRTYAASAPLAVALPDNLFLGEEPALAQVLDTHGATGLSVVAVVEILADEARRRGPTSVLPGELVGDEFRIARVPDKGARGSTFDTAGASSAFTGVGRYVFTPDAFDVIDEVERTLTPGAELDDIPVLQRLLARGRLTGRRIRGRFLDVGLPPGYAEADALLAGGGAPAR